jgi:hypothetical protein
MSPEVWTTMTLWSRWNTISSAARQETAGHPIDEDTAAWIDEVLFVFKAMLMFMFDEKRQKREPVSPVLAQLIKEALDRGARPVAKTGQNRDMDILRLAEGGTKP